MAYHPLKSSFAERMSDVIGNLGSSFGNAEMQRYKNKQAEIERKLELYKLTSQLQAQGGMQEPSYGSFMEGMSKELPQYNLPSAKPIEKQFKPLELHGITAQDAASGYDILTKDKKELGFRDVQTDEAKDIEIFTRGLGPKPDNIISIKKKPPWQMQLYGAGGIKDTSFERALNLIKSNPEYNKILTFVKLSPMERDITFSPDEKTAIEDRMKSMGLDPFTPDPVAAEWNFVKKYADLIRAGKPAVLPGPQPKTKPVFR